MTRNPDISNSTRTQTRRLGAGAAAALGAARSPAALAAAGAAVAALAVAWGVYEALAMPRLAIAVGVLGTALAMGGIVVASARGYQRIEARLGIASRALAGAGQGVVIGNAGDPSGDVPIVYANDAFAALTGYTIAEVVGRPFVFLAARDPGDAEALAGVGESLRDGESRTVMFRAMRKDGASFTCRMTVSGVPGAGGRRDHCVGLVEDVTAEQLAATARLELLAEATQARKDAEAAARARDELLASITHDLRSPLNASLTWADVLAASPQSDKTARAVEAIRRNLKLQARLVTDLIDTARMASGGIELFLERADLDRVVDRRIQGWRALAETAGVALDYTIGPGDYDIELDEERIVLAIEDLLTYAVHAARAGSRVDLALRADADGALVRIACERDAAEDGDAERAFAPYWDTGDRAAGRRRRLGAGVGLSVARHVAERHGGSLTAGTGTEPQRVVFRLRLPLPVPVRAPAAPAQSREAAH